VPVTGVAGDQQAATFGQACFRPGSAKTTYGTGAFALVDIGADPTPSAHGLLTTVLWQLGEGVAASVAYALEGSVFVAGSAVQWLRDGLGIIGSSGDVESLAASADPRSEVVVVPAFVGLGAPHWDPHARGAILGLTRGTTSADIARATVDSMAFQVLDVLEAMAADSGGPITALRVDGGAAGNDRLLQLQADLLGAPVERPRNVESTALGAAFLAGLAVGVWSGLDEVAATWELDRRFEPRMADAERADLVDRWRDAVERTKGWTRVGGLTA
jgi:glycerol kinase